jgi:hypothetical protein
VSTNEETDNGFEDAEDLVPVDLVPEREPLPIEPVRQLKGWHKPRKQWIRSEQWGRLAGRLLDNLSLDGRSLRYLTLPGRYLLDVRHLHGVCEQRGVRLKFLGFDTDRKDDPEITVSMDEVWRLPFIDKESEIKADRFEELCGKTMAAQALHHFGHFDIINLDLCDSVASRDAGASGSSLDAIKSLIEWQSNHRKEPWYLFLTTRADRETVKSSVMKILLQVVHDNLQRNSDFQRAAADAELFDEDSIVGEINRIETDAENTATLLDDEFMRAFGIGFSKWLLRLSLRAWKVKLGINACYRVGDEAQTPNMISLAFRFDSISEPIHDVIGLAPVTRIARQSVQTPSEDELAVLFLKRITKLIDVDELLHGDGELRERIVVANAELMAQARFDRQEVIDWGRSACWQPQ